MDQNSTDILRDTSTEYYGDRKMLCGIVRVNAVNAGGRFFCGKSFIMDS